MKLINKITEAQKARINLYRDQYLAYGRCVDRTDRALATQGINDIYLTLGKCPPKILFCKSPVEMYLTVFVLQNIGQNIRQNIGQNILQNIWQNIRQNIWQNIWQNIRQNIWQNIEQNIEQNIGQTLWGQHSAYWVCYYILFRDIFGLKYEELDNRSLNNIDKLVKSCGWWLPFEKFCIVSDRPEKLFIDKSGRLNNPNGKCVEYSDGYGLYSIAGVRVSEEVVTGKFSAKDIMLQPNQEVRRVMLEKYTIQKWLDDMNATMLQKDNAGELYNLPYDGRQLKFVSVWNNTPEPDGHKKEYLLFVEDSCTTAKEGVMSTWGLKPEVFEEMNFRS